MPATIEDRVKARMADERDRLNTLAGEHASKREDADADRRTLLQAGEPAIQAAIDTGDPEQIAAAVALYATAGKAAKASIAEALMEREIQATISQLDDPATLQARLERAVRLEAEKPVSMREAAIRVLLADDPDGTGLHYRTMWDAIAQAGLVESARGGQTPEATLNAMLAVDAKKESATFKRAEAKGVFALVDAAAARAALPPREPAEPAEPAAAGPAKPKRTAAKATSAKPAASKAPAKRARAAKA